MDAQQIHDAEVRHDMWKAAKDPSQPTPMCDNFDCLEVSTHLAMGRFVCLDHLKGELN